MDDLGFALLDLLISTSVEMVMLFGVLAALTPCELRESVTTVTNKRPQKYERHAFGEFHRMK